MGIGRTAVLLDAHSVFGDRSLRGAELPHDLGAHNARSFMTTALHARTSGKARPKSRMPIVVAAPAGRRGAAANDRSRDRHGSVAAAAQPPVAIASIVSLTKMFADITLSVERELRDLRIAQRVPKTYELYNNPLFHRTETNGDDCLAAIRRTLDEFGFKRHSNQLHFHEEMIKACLRIIYRHDYEQNIDRVLADNGWSKIVQEVLIITARRIGTHGGACGSPRPPSLDFGEGGREGRGSRRRRRRRRRSALFRCMRLTMASCARVFAQAKQRPWPCSPRRC